MTLIKYSICIPAYNVEQVIEDTLNSVFFSLNTRSDVEIIIIDDGSTDNTSNIINSFLLKNNFNNIFQYVKTSNNGRSAARNSAVNISKGEYIVFIDSDDLIDKGYFDELDKIISQESSFFVFSQVVFVNSDIVLIGEQNSFHQERSIYENLLYGLLPYTSAICVKKTLFQEIGGFNVSLREREDWHLTARIAIYCLINQKQISFLSERFIRVRIHDGNNSKNNIGFLQSTISVYSSLINELKKHTTNSEIKLHQFNIMCCNIKHFSSRRIPWSMKVLGLQFFCSAFYLKCFLSYKNKVKLVMSFFKILLVNYGK